MFVLRLKNIDYNKIFGVYDTYQNAFQDLKNLVDYGMISDGTLEIIKMDINKFYKSNDFEVITTYEL